MPNGLTDFVFGKKALDTAAKGSAPASVPGPSQADSAAMAQRNSDYAAKRLASQKSGSPLATPMNPQTQNKGKK